jgi:tetratricopeptide (TPR) repeat protein
MNRSLLTTAVAGLLFSPLVLSVSAAGALTRTMASDAPLSILGEFQAPATQAKQTSDAAAEAQKREEAASRAKLQKDHMANGNRAMEDARTIREQLQTATGPERSALTAKMQADYQTAIAEYREALQNSRLAEGDNIQPLGLIRLLRNGLISQEKALDMTAQDKNVPIIMSNLGMAYSGAGDYADAIPLLQQAILSKPEPTTYMQLGTDLAEVGKVPDASATCDKIVAADPATVEVKDACYRNIAVVLMNQGKPADAVGPLQSAAQVNPNDALAWKLLGDALSNGITTRQEGAKLVYIIPAGTVEAYQKYLQLQPNGVYAGQVKATLDGFAQLAKAPTSVRTGKTP